MKLKMLGKNFSVKMYKIELKISKTDIKKRGAQRAKE